MKLQLGAHLSCNGPYGGVGIVAAIHGELGSEQSHGFGGVVFMQRDGATVDVIYDDGRLAAGLRESFLRDPSPWRLMSRDPATAEEIAAAWALHASFKATAAAKKLEANRAFIENTAKLAAEYPYLATADKGGNLTLAAKNVRTLLKRAWPLVTFSVKTARFSGGDDLRVRWTDGPASAAVNEIVGLFAGGSFDGMTDSYTHEHSPWTALFGEAKYTSCDRDNSPAAVLAACAKSIELGEAGAWTDAAIMAEAWNMGRIQDHWIRQSVQAALNGMPGWSQAA